MAILADPPIRDALTTPELGLMNRLWQDWLETVTNAVDRAPRRKADAVTLTGQGASIAATDMTGGTLEAGLYLVSYYARITRAALTSSSLTVTIDWTDDGLNPSYSGAAMTGNTTTTTQSGVILLESDEDSAINYSTTYASVGAVSMQYKLDVVVEQVPI